MPPDYEKINVPLPSGLVTMMHCEICQQIGRMLSASTPLDTSADTA